MCFVCPAPFLFKSQAMFRCYNGCKHCSEHEFHSNFPITHQILHSYYYHHLNLEFSYLIKMTRGIRLVIMLEPTLFKVPQTITLVNNFVLRRFQICPQFFSVAYQVFIWIIIKIIICQRFHYDLLPWLQVTKRQYNKKYSHTFSSYYLRVRFSNSWNFFLKCHSNKLQSPSRDLTNLYVITVVCCNHFR